MENSAQKITDHGEYYSPIASKARHWLTQELGRSAVLTWIEMQDAPTGFNHYPKDLARKYGKSIRTIQRHLRQLADAGAVIRKSKQISRYKTVYYYQALEIPKRYLDHNVVQFPRQNIRLLPAKTVDKPRVNRPKIADQKLNATTKVAHLNKLIKNTNTKHSKTSHHTPPHKDSNRAVQNLYGERVRVINLRYHFLNLLDAYPAEKVPWSNPKYLAACFKQFKQLCAGEKPEIVAMLVEYLGRDVSIRMEDCLHWQDPEDRPSLFIYLKERRWLLPVEYSFAKREAHRQEFAGIGLPSGPSEYKRAQIGTQELTDANKK